MDIRMRGRSATGLSLIRCCPSVLHSSSGILRTPRVISTMLPTQALLTLVSYNNAGTAGYARPFGALSSSQLGAAGSGITMRALC